MKTTNYRKLSQGGWEWVQAASSGSSSTCSARAAAAATAAGAAGLGRQARGHTLGRGDDLRQARATSARAHEDLLSRSRRRAGAHWRLG